MKRRDFITVLAGAVTHPRWAGAQQRSQLPLVGIFGGSVRLEYDAFLQGMRGLGYVEGRNISYAQRLQAGGSESAQELIGLNPELIVCPGGVTAPRLLMDATSTIPIVMVTGSDVVENGLVISLARPGGNVTGLSYQTRT